MITAIIRTVISETVCSIPSETIRVVAPAGGCSTEKRIVKAKVSTSDSVAAKINSIDIPETIAPGALFNPNIAKLTYPHIAAIRCPKMVFLGEAFLENG
jgi:hypothetical protein